jgi:hypothetical protein
MEKELKIWNGCNVYRVGRELNSNRALIDNLCLIRGRQTFLHFMLNVPADNSVKSASLPKQQYGGTDKQFHFESAEYISLLRIV